MRHLIQISFTTDHKQFLPGDVTDHDFGEQRAADLRRDGFIDDAPEPEEAPAVPQEADEAADRAPLKKFRRG